MLRDDRDHHAVYQRGGFEEADKIANTTEQGISSILALISAPTISRSLAAEAMCRAWLQSTSAPE